MKYKNTSFPDSFYILDHDLNLETKFFLLRKKGYSVLRLVKRKPPRGWGFKDGRCAQSQGLVGMVLGPQRSHRLKSQGLLPRSRRREQILKETLPGSTGQIGHAPHYAMFQIKLNEWVPGPRTGGDWGVNEDPADPRQPFGEFKNGTWDLKGTLDLMDLQDNGAGGTPARSGSESKLNQAPKYSKNMLKGYPGMRRDMYSRHMGDDRTKVSFYQCSATIRRMLWNLTGKPLGYTGRFPITHP